MCGNNVSSLVTKKVRYELLVRTGDQKGKGTDANVFVILTGKNGLKTSTIPLTYTFRDNFESGHIDTFPINVRSSDGHPLGMVMELEFWRDQTAVEIVDNSWFCDLFILVDLDTGKINNG